MGGRLVHASAFAAILTISYVGPAYGQTVTGVVQGLTGQSMPDTYVALLDEAEEVVASTLSGADGSFVVTAPAPGWYHIYTTRVGYRSIFDGLFELTEGEPLEVLIRIHELPIPIDSVTVSVEGEVAQLAAVGFYDRKQRGFGHFMEYEEVQRRSGSRFTDALRHLPRISMVNPAPAFGTPGMLQGPRLQIRGGGPSGLCTPAVFLDGIRASNGDVLRLDNFVVPSHVEGVEYYTGPDEAPLQYAAEASCGVILIWSRRTGRIG